MAAELNINCDPIVSVGFRAPDALPMTRLMANATEAVGPNEVAIPTAILACGSCELFREFTFPTHEAEVKFAGKNTAMGTVTSAAFLNENCPMNVSPLGDSAVQLPVRGLAGAIS